MADVYVGLETFKVYINSEALSCLACL